MNTLQDEKTPALIDDCMTEPRQCPTLRRFNGAFMRLPGCIAATSHMQLLKLPSVQDKCLEAGVDYFLSPTDQRHYPTFEYNYSLAGSRPMFRRSHHLLDFGIDEPGSVVGPKGWLFHDYRPITRMAWISPKWHLWSC